ncbi:MAG: hypothetical protein EOM87_02485 [Clostridia bacterium]|nr:hypothetical protein [Clostridia bacterium]
MAGKTNGVLIGIAIVAVVKALMFIFKVSVKTISNVIVFLGLYIPLFYSVFALIIYSMFSLDFNTLNLELILLLSGLGLSFLCSAIIAIRNLIVKPFKSIFVSANSQEFPTYRREEQRYYERRRATTPRYYDEEYNYGEDYRGVEERERNAINNERVSEVAPMVYYSEREPNLLIYEYEDRFEVFRDDGREPKRYIRTEYK